MPTNEYGRTIRGRTSLLLAIFSICFFQTAFAQQGATLLQQAIPRVPCLVTTKGTIGAKECVLIIDTGAEFTILEHSMTDVLREKLHNASFGDGSGRQTPLELYSGLPLKFQSLAIERPTVAILDVRPLTKYLDRNINGVMGVNLLRTGVLSVDNDRAALELHAPPWKWNNESSTEIELLDHIVLPTFETYIAGRYGQFLVDTGNMGNISLETSLFTALVRNGSIEVSDTKAHTVGASGSIEVRSGWFLKGDLMGKSLAGMTVDETFGRSAVGVQWLYGFNFELDLQSHRFRYAERRQVRKPPAVYPMIGAILLYGPNGPEIERLSPDSDGAARVAGLNSGDVIEKFDSLEASAMNYASVAELVTVKAGKEIPIRYVRKSDGATLQTTLKLPALISPWSSKSKTAADEETSK